MNYEQRHPVRKDGKLVECNDFRGLLQTRVQSLKNGNISDPMTIRFVSRWQLQLPRRPRRILGARGLTALHAAAVNGHAAVVEQLISAGATVDAANNDGRGLGRVSGSFWEWL